MLVNREIKLNNYVTIDIKINPIHYEILVKELNKHNITLESYLKDCLSNLRNIKELE